ncbi:MAG: hypothetical protein M1824_005291 [Vezdaea acicularis]|nr:MAG: hypothetical protein M1824_005291 [Vezdaea acicularis]
MSTGSLDRTPSVDSMSPTGYSPESIEALESRKSVDSMNGTNILPPRPSPATQQRGSVISESETTIPIPASSRSSINNKYGGDHTRDALLMDAPQSLPHGETYEDINLPPPPSAMPDDFDSVTTSPPRTLNHSRTESATVRSSTSTAPSSIYPSHTEKSTSLELEATASVPNSSDSRKTPLTEQETKVAVELLFAVINELYTLSSAWNIRRTLLTAAKTFLLRPGNPNLESIRVLIQDSVIEANVSDAGIASHINKLRSSSLPTEEELKSFPPPRTPEEKGKLRLKARKLLVERGMPQALTSVMGSAASGEALGRVFDCLQVEDVARGLVFGLLLQAVRAVTQ